MSHLSIEESKDLAWGGRVWVQSNHAELRNQEQFHNIVNESLPSTRKSIRLLSYHTLASYKAQQLTYSSVKDPIFRNQQLISELSSYDAEIICLQDIDHYDTYWFPSLYKLGYESVFSQRTNARGTYYEGVVIGYKKDMFRIFKSSPIHFNHAADNYNERGLAFKGRCISDDVGLMVIIQPQSSSMISTLLPPALCVGCAMFNNDHNGEIIRQLQSIYFTKQIEHFNKDILAPVLLGVSMHDIPSSPSYHIMRTGRIPIQGDVPKRCSPPHAVPICRGSVRLHWKPPMMNAADPVIKSFLISWRPGGSLVLGFDSQISLLYEDCLDYKNKKKSASSSRKHNPHHTSHQQVELSHVITGLSSDLPYEFRVAASNDMGEGLWSEVSMPIQMHNPSLNPMPELVMLRSLPEVIELRESTATKMRDQNINNMAVSDAVNSATSQSPRYIDGGKVNVASTCLLPAMINPRIGWAAHLNGGVSQELHDALNQPHILKKSGLRDIHGNYSAAVSDTPGGRIVKTSLLTKHEELLLDTTIHDDSCDHDHMDMMNNQVSPSGDEDFFAGGGRPFPDDSDSDNDDSTSNYVDGTGNNLPINQLSYAESDQLHHLQPTYMQFHDYLADDHRDLTILDCKDFAKTISTKSERQVHELRLRSAYESYSAGGEPVYTISQPIASSDDRTLIDCMDYLFYSSNSFILNRILTIPSLHELRGNDPLEPVVSLDLNWIQPPTGLRNIFNQHHPHISDVHVSHHHDDHDKPATKKPASRRDSSFVPGAQALRRSLEGRLIAASRSLLSSSTTHDHHLHAHYKSQLRRSLQQSMQAEPVIPVVPSYRSSSLISPKATSHIKTDNKSNTFWAGTWASTFPRRNSYKESMYLPTKVYCSSHMAICTELIFNPS